MTTAQRNVHTALEAQRFTAQQAARPALTPREQAQSLYHAMMAAKQAGRIEDAKALANELRPLIDYLD